jgi:alpha-tubulin suppressor-like RCC1 family protein
MTGSPSAFSQGVPSAARSVSSGLGGATGFQASWDNHFRRELSSATLSANCKDVLFVGARGSGQSSGLGGQVTDFRDALRTRLPSAWSMESVPLAKDDGYPAYSVFRLVHPKLGLAQYLSGISTGVTLAMGILQQRAATCPNQRIVLAGFSQGAMVMHRVARRLVTDGDSQILDRIAGIYLVGDGDREKNTGAQLWGSAGLHGWGIDRPLKGDLPIPARLEGRTHEVCKKRDPVCDLSYYLTGLNGLVSRSSLIRLLAGVGLGAWKVHVGDGYKAGSALVNQPALAVANVVQAWPKARSITVIGNPGVQIERQIPIDVRSDLRSRVAVYDLKNLPPGLSISTTGKILGTPTSEGTWHTSFRTRISTSGFLSNGLPGAVTFNIVPPGSGGAGAWLSINSDWGTTCGLRSDGTAWCWGKNDAGQIGNGDTTRANVYTPYQLPGHWTAITPGARSATCGVRTDGTGWCWGSNDSGQVGNGDASGANVYSPHQLPGTWSTIQNGSYDGTTCGMQTNGTAWCWGTNVYGAVGDGNPAEAAVYTPYQLPDNWISITAGGYTTCGVKVDRSGWCWGFNGQGQVGNGDTTGANVYTPHPLPGTWTMLRTTDSATCGVQTNGTGWCWGEPYQVGNGDLTSYVYYPYQLPGSWTTITPGTVDAVTCGVQTDDTGWCWGDNSYGEVGNGDTSGPGPYTPYQLPGSWVTITPERNSWTACGLQTDGTGWCWGNNANGAVGNGDSTGANVFSPSQLPGSWVALTAGSLGSINCGVQTDGSGWCWGYNRSGEVGNGDVTGANVFSPQRLS